MPAKTCNRCKVFKPLDDFHSKASAKDGRQSMCVDCKSEWYYTMPFLQRVPRELAQRRRAGTSRVMARNRERRRRELGWYDEGGMATTPLRLTPLTATL